VRELRQNASLRPSRSRYKIYYIDEVHMLSTGAFNALLKTLEEPPPHVKFFFATTEANKIPITVLSRCQRYDFAGITPEAIVSSLKEICTREQVEAEPEALQVVARRAGGSMRDAQSLLEQLLASGSPRLTVEVVHTLLGTPSDERLLAVLEALADRDSAAALSLLEQASAEGVQPTDLVAGVLEFLRDAMVLSVGAGAVLMAVTPRQRPRLQRIVDRWSIDAILAALQILAEARARMRAVAHSRLLAELALVRIARLENLSEISELVERVTALQSGSPRLNKAPAQRAKKMLSPAQITAEHESLVPESVQALARPPARSDLPERAQQPPTAALSAALDAGGQGASEGAAARAPGDRAEQTHPDRPPLNLDAVRQLWPELVKKVGAKLGMRLVAVEAIGIEEPDILVIAAKPGYNSLADPCGTDEAREKLGQYLQRLLRRPVTVRYQQSAGLQPSGSRPASSEARRPELLAGDSMVQKVVELFEARPLHLEYDDDPEPA